MWENNNSVVDDQHDGNGVFGQVAKVIPYFRKKRNVLLFKLDIMLLLWMFVAGVSSFRLPMMRASIDLVTVDQRTGPICNNPSLRLGNARRSQSVRQRARQFQHILLHRLCDRIDSWSDHSDKDPALAVFAML